METLSLAQIRAANSETTQGWFNKEGVKARFSKKIYPGNYFVYSLQSKPRSYFVAQMQEDGGIATVVWFEPTNKAAHRAAKYLSDSSDVGVC